MDSIKSKISKIPEQSGEGVMKPVILFLCTPRCGTQWLAKNLSEIYSSEVIALHEPLESNYHLKDNLGRYESAAELTENMNLNKHLNFVEEVTQDMSYIEVGWPDIAGIPEFYHRFGERLKLIHLYRNPVKVAASMVTHNWYTGSVKERSENLELTPFDDAAMLKEYQSRWDDLSLLEKSLYYWTEINLRAIEIKCRYPTVPFYALKFENLFKENKETSRITLIEMLAFMGLKYESKMLEALDVKQDKYRYKSTISMDWKDIYKHPQTITLANKLGYGFDSEIDLYRYKKTLYNRITNKIRSLLKKILQRE